MLTADRKRAFGPWLFGASLLLLVLWIAITTGDMAERNQNPLLIFMFSGNIVPIYMIMPLLCAVPFAAGFANDWRSGMAVMMLVRSGRERFLRSKLLGCMLSGGLVAMIATAAYAIFVHLWFIGGYTGNEQIIADFSYWDFSGGYTAQALLGYYSVQLVLQFLAGAFYATSALAFSAFVPNVSLTLCAPLVLYRLFEELGEVLPSNLSPYQLQNGSAGLTTLPTLGWALCVFGLGTLLFALVFRLRAGRRLADT